MRSLGVLLLAACAARPPIDSDFVIPAAGPYPLRPTFRSATGGAIHIRRDGFGDLDVDVPYARALTLRTALRIAGIFPGRSITLVRSELAVSRTYELPGSAIVEGRALDPELAPGDTILIPEDLCSAGICD